MQDDPFAEMAAALNEHQVTGDEGQLSETTDIDNSADQETNTVDETATVEKPAGSQATAPKAGVDETETQLAEDETGKRYVPEQRFKEVYGKQKALERELEALRKQAPAYQPSLQPAQPVQPNPNQTVDKTTALELDLLKMTLPQFNPDSDDYDSELDKLGAQIYSANKGITMLEAGRRAMATAKALTSKQTQIAAEARQVKALQSDQGITNRVKSKGETDSVDPEKMTLDQKEEWLKSNGQW